MEDRFQNALDSQWDALEARDTRIVGIRKHLTELFNELVDKRTDEIRLLNQDIKNARETITKTEKGALKQSELQHSLDELDASDLPKEISEISGKVSLIDAEIEKLVQQREELSSRMSDLKSIYSSRRAKFENTLHDLNRAHQQQIVKLPSMKSGLNKNIKICESAERELHAAKHGGLLWSQVCSTLTNLDREIHGYGKSQLPQISFILDKAVQQMESFLKTAEGEKWSVLVIAIGHELQLLRETLNVVRKHGEDV